MLKIEAPDYKFCPFCGDTLQTRVEEEKERKFCPPCNWTYYPRVAAAAAAIIPEDKKVWLVRRNREPYRGLWMFPAGFVDFGEHPEETLVREVVEEIGRKVIEARLVGILQSEDDPREPGHWVLFYKAKTIEGSEITDPEENQAVEQFDIQNLPEIGWGAHRKMAKLLQEGKI